MAMKIFIDVGAFKGETLKMAMDKKYAFDKIYCFEPIPEHCVGLREMADDRVTIFEGGMWNKTGIRKIYNPGRRGASMFKDKNGNRYGGKSIKIIVRSAAKWFKEYITDEDDVYLKLNCEGAEWAILDDLMKSGEHKKIHVLMADLDIRKIPSQRHLVDSLKERLRNSGIPKLYLADEYGRVNHEKFTNNYLTENN